MKKKYGLIMGCFMIVALCLIYVGLGAYTDHSEAEEQERAEAEKLYMTDLTGVKRISYDNAGTVLSFTKDGDTWKYDGDDEFPVNASRMDSLAETVKKLPAIRKLEGGDELSAYGLDTPLRRITVEAEDDAELTILIGSGTEDGNYYAVIDGEETPWLISSALFDETSWGLEDMLAFEQFPAISGTDIRTITIEKDGVIEHYVKKTLDEAGTIAWYRDSADTEDNKLPDNSALNVLAESLSGLTVKSCANYKVTEEELAGYGLCQPEAVISYTYEESDEEKTFSLSVGAAGGDGTTYYTRTKDSRYVNEIDKTALDQCLKVDTGSQSSES